jgi:hypothetical protein
VKFKIRPETIPLSINRPNCRQILDCASPSAFAARQSAAPARRRLALWADAGSAKAVEGHRSPRRYRADASFLQFMAPLYDFTDDGKARLVKVVAVPLCGISRL